MVSHPHPPEENWQEGGPLPHLQLRAPHQNSNIPMKEVSLNTLREAIGLQYPKESQRQIFAKKDAQLLQVGEVGVLACALGAERW